MRLPLPLKRRPAIWLGILGVPLLPLVAATGYPAVPAEAWWTTTLAGSTMLVTVSGGLSAVATTLETARIRRLRRVGTVVARPWPAALGDALWPGIVVGFLLQTCGIVITAIRDSGPSGTPSAGLLLAIGSALLSFAAFGALCGALLPPVFAVPVSLCGSYLWLSFPGSIEWAPLRHLTVSNFSGLSSPDLEPAPGSLLAVTVWSLGMSVGLLLLTAAALGLGGRAGATLTLGLTVVLASTGCALYIARDLGYESVRQRNLADLVCTPGTTAICLYPEQRGGAVTAEEIQGYVARLSRAGIAVPQRVIAGSGIAAGAEPGTVVLRYSTEMTAAQAAGSLATSLVPQLSTTCGDDPGYGQELFDVTMLSAGWYLHTMIPELTTADVSAQVGAPEARLGDLLATGADAQAAWLERAQTAGRNCDQNPGLLP